MARRSGSAADFPYDEHMQARSLSGLERLRTIPDRRLAEYLYQLHAQVERNEAIQRVTPTQTSPKVASLERVAKRALGGELGPEARELADYLLLDEAGRERIDEASLLTFGRALQELRRSQR